MTLFAYLILLILLLIFSAFFSGSETALFSLTSFQRKIIATNNPRISKVISTLLESPRRTLATILIGNMLVNITAASTATVLAISIFGEKGVGISIIAMTLILLVFGEVSPKTLAIKNAEGFSSFCSWPLHIFGKIVWPLRRLLRLVADIFIALFVFKRESKPYITQKELKALMSISEKEGIIGKKEEKMIRSIFDMGERSIDEIMTPRVDITAGDRKASRAELIEVMKGSKHTKIPIYEATIDNIIGVIYTKEFMLNPQDDFSAYIKKPLYVSEAAKVGELLVRFQSEKVYIAVVIDEFGGTSGIVTLKDVLEEIVGEIQDEYGRAAPSIKKEDDGTFTIVGKATIREINRRLNLDLPTDAVTTINGLLLLLSGRVPRQGESIKFKDVVFHILEVKNNMVTKVQATKIK